MSDDDDEMPGLTTAGTSDEDSDSPPSPKSKTLSEAEKRAKADEFKIQGNDYYKKKKYEEVNGSFMTRVLVDMFDPGRLLAQSLWTKLKNLVDRRPSKPTRQASSMNQMPSCIPIELPATRSCR
jgi:hypothetical protein